MIARAFEENVQRIFIPNVDQHTVNGMMDIVASHPEKCFPMMGLHPCHVKEDFKAELAVLKTHLDLGGFFVPLAKLAWICIGTRLLLKNKRSVSYPNPLGQRKRFAYCHSLP